MNYRITIRISLKLIMPLGAYCASRDMKNPQVIDRLTEIGFASIAYRNAIRLFPIRIAKDPVPTNDDTAAIRSIFMDAGFC